MRSMIYIALVIVLTAPLVWVWNPIRRWLAPELPVGRILLRVLAMSIAYMVYASLAFWLAITLMGLFVR